LITKVSASVYQLDKLAPIIEDAAFSKNSNGYSSELDTTKLKKC